MSECFQNSYTVQGTVLGAKGPGKRKIKKTF